MSIVILESLSPISHPIRSSQSVHQPLVFLLSRDFIPAKYALAAKCKSQSLPTTQQKPQEIKEQYPHRRHGSTTTRRFVYVQPYTRATITQSSHLHSSRLVQTHIHQPGIMDHRLLRQQQDLLLRNLRQST